jgi:riboflavin kinase/FMN adenylyltransferase
VVQVKIGMDSYFGMANIGYRPTIRLQKHELTAEVNILHFDKDIYGKEITICFLEKIREEERFNGLNQLKEQLRKDKSRVELIVGRLKDS